MLILTCLTYIKKDSLQPFEQTQLAVGSVSILNNREVKIVNTGIVFQVGDDIACIHGLDEVMAGELVEFEQGTIGIVLNLIQYCWCYINRGHFVKATGRIAQIPVSKGYLGRVINALAKPIDGGGEISASESRLIESPTPDIISRRSIYEPLQTRLIAIDSMIPIGCGQRELIIGGRGAGKTAVATDTILNQQGQKLLVKKHLLWRRYRNGLAKPLRARAIAKVSLHRAVVTTYGTQRRPPIKLRARNVSRQFQISSLGIGSRKEGMNPHSYKQGKKEAFVQASDPGEVTQGAKSSLLLEAS
ncbi:LOW QUALITY PROTEIN: hypothetical protein Cgig2_024587 [Carnegiea gigantea]|uniref:Uncharacterized protein n=1 Tax=Carnegiea gigantea TaxID=171969 RepID=A0A9Q1KK30_9CARY|nr:LOW QUALITY PROTEIN: hypothetical protein Cgig2_024587 [Carnegiea gigantea]